MRINKGRIDFKTKIYTKYVKFSSAVLWKTRELSIPLPVQSNITANGITKLIFIDNGKNEQWIFDTDKVMKAGERKMVGQEPQWYFPIELAVKKPVKEIFMYK